MNDSDPKEESVVATYVSQWIFRTIDSSYIFVCEYFFNDGTLDGENLLYQFSHIVRCLELVGFRVHGLVSDSGSSNVQMFDLIR